MPNLFWFSLFVSLNAIILVALAANVSVLRLRFKISYGDGDNKTLLRAIRVHANGMEQVPVFSLVLLALTFAELHSALLAVLVISFTLARVAHIGMLFRLHAFRRIGASLTYLLQIIAASLLLYLLLS